jgi:LuxR family maltose regulon positive regulatory protein
MLRSAAAMVDGRWTEGGVLAGAARDELGEGWWRDPFGRFCWNMITRDIALSERWDDGSDDIRHAELALSRDPERRLAFEGTRALGHALVGRPLEALRIAAGVRRTAAVPNMTTLRAELAAAEAIAHRELGDHALATAELEALAGTPAETMLYCRVLAGLELAGARLDAGDVPAACAAFGEVEELVERERLGADGRAWLARSGTVVSLAVGDVAAARRWADQVGDPFWGPLAVARVRLAESDRPGARAALDAAVARSVRQEVVFGLVRARALDDHEEAMKSVTSAVEQASEQGMLRTVASECAGLEELIEQAAWRVPPAWIDRLRRAALTARSAGGGPRDALAELTDRERDVLRFLPSRLTLGEIAGELYVSVNTLKFHLKIIYRKLGVNSRGEAAEVARRMTLVNRRP